MPKRPSKASGRASIRLAVVAIALFVVGEAAVMSRTEAWRLTAARHLGFGDRARITQLVGKSLWRGLESAGIPRDSVRERIEDGGPAPVRWRVGLKAGASLLQANYALTRNAEEAGASVISGREETGPHGESEVQLLVGLPGRPTHQVLLVRPAASVEQIAAAGARLALVVYGFADATVAAEFLDLRVPFTAALVPGEKGSHDAFRAARESQREVVLHLPLEPINYPQVNPGPGTVLVTMKPSRIAALVDRYLDEAGPVTAVSNDMGSLATQDMEVMGAVYGELRRRGLPFLHMQPAAGSVCKRLASELGVGYETPGEVIDLEPRAEKPARLDERWRHALERARERGQLIVMLRATPLTKTWLAGATTSKRLKGVSLVPLGSLLKPHGML